MFYGEGVATINVCYLSPKAFKIILNKATIKYVHNNIIISFIVELFIFSYLTGLLF